MKPTLLNLCLNDNKKYSPVPAAPILNAQELTPLAAVTGKIILGAPGQILALDRHDSTTQQIGTCVGHPDCAVDNGNGRVIVMSPDDDPVRVNAVQGTQSDNPNFAVRLYAYETGQVTVTVAETPLSKEYGPGEIDDPDDIAAIQLNLHEAYERAALRVAATGNIFQPVICYVEILAPDKTTIYRGPQRLVLPPTGLFGSKPVELTMDTRGHIASTKLTIPTYNIGVDIIAPDGTDFTGYIVAFYQSSQIHPCGPESECAGPITVVRSGTADVKVLATLPGSQYGLSESETERSVYIMHKLFSAAGVTAEIRKMQFGPNDPLTGIDDMAVTRLPFDEEVAEIRKIVDLPATPVGPGELYRRLCSPPHAFTAAVCASTPSAVAWGNLKARRFAGYAACEFGATFAKNTPWHSTVTVTFDDGTTARRVMSGAENMPIQLDVVLSYPDPSAVHIDIVVEPDVEGGTPMRWSTDLSPDMSGLTALGIATPVQLREPVEDTEAWITVNTDVRPAPLPLAGYMAVARANAPLSPELLISLGNPVTALAAATSTSGAWDFGRTRFFAFTAGRTALVNIDKEFKSAGIGTLAAAGAVNVSAVTAAPGGAVYFASGRSVLGVNGTRVRALMVLDHQVDRLGFDAVRGEIVAACSSGADPVYHFVPGNKDVAFNTTSPGPTNRWLSVGDSIYVESQSGLIDISVGACRDSGQPVYIGLLTVARVPLATPGRSIRRVIWNVDAELFNGNFTVCRNYLRTRRADVSRYRVNGRLASPTVMPLLSRYMASAALEIAGVVSSDAVIDLPDIEIA